MASSRTTYTALTPEFADFAIPHTPVTLTSRLGPRGEAFADESHDTLADDERGDSGRMRAWLASAKATVKNNTGLLLIAASQAFFSLMNVAVKKLNGIDPPVSTFELIIVRMGITYICSIAYMLSTGVQDPFLGPKGVRILLMLRGFTGFFGLFGIYYSLEYLSLSDATVLTFLAPMCTAIAGALLLGENFTRREAIAGLISLVGVVLIARPTAIFGNVHVPEVPNIADGVTSAPMDSAEKGTPRDRLIAVGVALLGVLGATGAYTSIRAVGKRAHPLHSLTFFSTLCVIVSIPGMIITKTPIVVPNRLEWLMLLAMIGLFGFFAQILLTMGLQRETAGRGSMAIYTQVVFATILERIFFKTAPTFLSVTGTLLILASATYVALTKEQETPVAAKYVHLHSIPAADSELEEGLLNAQDDSQELTTPRGSDKNGRHVRFDNDRRNDSK